MTRKAICVLAGGRDYFQVPLALAESNLLSRLVTDAYAPLERLPSGTQKIASRFGIDTSKRYAKGMPSNLVKVDLQAFAWSALGQLKINLNYCNRKKDKCLSLRAANLAIKNNLPLFAYSYYAGHAFEKLLRTGLPRILFQVHPAPTVLRRIFTEESTLVPAASSSLNAEFEMGELNPALNALCNEPLNATAIAVASSFSASTLVDAGVNPNLITVIPYGVDFEKYVTRTALPDKRQTLRVLFVGSLIQRKGLSYLLEATQALGPTAVKLVLCTRGFVDQQLLGSYPNANIEVKHNLPQPDIVKEMWQSDLFVLPSIAEGFGHVLAEALATGLPILTTPNTAGPDLITNQVEGFIVPIRDPNAIAERLDWATTHREQLFEMGQVGAVRIRQFTWQRFRNSVADFYRSSSDNLM